MGWGARLIGIGKIVGGAAMMYGTGGAAAGYAVPLMASGGTDIISDMAAEKGNEAIEKATGQQQQATDKAVGLQQQVYNQSQANLAPFINTGNQALGALNMMHGYAPMSSTSLPSLAAPTGPTNTTTTAVPRPPAEGTGAVRRPLMQDPQASAQMSTQSAYGGGTLGDLAGGVPQTVRVRSPRGQEAIFVSGDPNLQKALSLGAQVI